MAPAVSTPDKQISSVSLHRGDCLGCLSLFWSDSLPWNFGTLKGPTKVIDFQFVHIFLVITSLNAQVLYMAKLKQEVVM